MLQLCDWRPGESEDKNKKTFGDKPPIVELVGDPDILKIYVLAKIGQI